MPDNQRLAEMRRDLEGWLHARVELEQEPGVPPNPLLNEDIEERVRRIEHAAGLREQAMQREESQRARIASIDAEIARLDEEND